MSAEKCWRHDYNHREYICRCDPPVEGDTGVAADHMDAVYGEDSRITPAPAVTDRIAAKSPRYCAWASCPHGKPYARPDDCCMGLPHAPTPAPTVTDSSQADRLPTGHVHLAGVGEASDAELADLAGYCSRHFGYSVSRWVDDDTATVHLFND